MGDTGGEKEYAIPQTTSADKVFTFEEEEERDKAIRLLQRCYRAKTAREHLKALVRDNYVKIYDKINSTYAYKNRTTGEVSFEKPVFLGSDDLPTPKKLNAPPDYDPGTNMDDSDGAALVVCVNKFKHEKMSGLGGGVSADHMGITDLLCHEYIGKLRMENVISVKNPTCTQFIDAFERLRKVARKDSFVFIYICTHIVTVKNGERGNNSRVSKNKSSSKMSGKASGKISSKASAKGRARGKALLGANSKNSAALPPLTVGFNTKKEDTYFCMEDTVWKDAKGVAASSIALFKLVNMIKRLPCQKRTIALNYAHGKMQKKTFFGNSKLQYPPENFLFRLSESTNSAVMGSCAIGFKLKTVIQNTPRYIEFLARKKKKEEKQKALEEAKQAEKLAKRKNFAERISTLFGGGKAKNKEKDENGVAFGFGSTNFVGDGFDEFEDERPKTPVEVKPTKKNVFDAAAEELAVIDEITQSFRAQWSTPPDIENVVSEKPAPPKPTVEKDEDGKWVIHIPDDNEMLSHSFSTIYWRYRRLIEPPKNIYNNLRNHWKLKNLRAPYQYSLGVGDSYTLFGKAIIEGINGCCSSPEKHFVTIKTLFEYVKESVAKECGSMAADASTKQQPNQSVVLVLPKGNYDAINNPIFYRCGPPSAPERPFVVRIGRHDVTLQWYDPLFDGVPPSLYRIYMKNVSRCFNQWSPIDYKGVVRTTKFTIKDLPAGVHCAFRICGFNNGGWGLPSEETPLICPGEEYTPLPHNVRWRKLSLGGPLAVIDRLQYYPDHRHEYITGLRKVLIFAQKMDGFHKGTVQLKVAAVAMHAIDRFPRDRELAGLAFELMGYAMQGPKDRKVRLYLSQNGIVAKCDENLEFFRIDPYVVAGITHLRRLMPKGFIHETPEMIHEVEPEAAEDSDTSDDEDLPESVN